MACKTERSSTINTIKINSTKSLKARDREASLQVPQINQSFLQYFANSNLPLPDKNLHLTSSHSTRNNRIFLLFIPVWTALYTCITI